MKKWIRKIVAVATTAACAMSGFGQVAFAEEDTIKIGGQYELSGDSAAYGQQMSYGTKLAIKEANERGGVLGKQIEYIEYDNKSDATEAAIVASQLVEDGVTGIVGPATLGASQPMFPIVNEEEVPVVLPVVKDLVGTYDDVSYIYRMAYVDKVQTTAAAKFAVENLNAPKAVILINTSMDYSTDLAANFTRDFEEVGGEIVGEEYFESGQDDFRTILTNIQALDFDIIYVPAYYSEVGPIIRQAREMGIEQPFMGADGFDSKILVELAGAENLNDIYYVTHFSPVTGGEAVETYLKAYEEEYGEPSDTFAALAYDSTNFLLQAIEKAGSTDPVEVNKVLADFGPFTGVSGTFELDENHNPDKEAFVIEMQNGEVVDSTAIGLD